MVKSDDGNSSGSESSTEKYNQRMPDNDYPGLKYLSGEPSEKSIDQFSDSASDRFNFSEMESDIIDRNPTSESNENSESGSGCNLENMNSVLLRGQDPACSSPVREVWKSMDFTECMKGRTRSIDSSKCSSDVEDKPDEYKSILIIIIYIYLHKIHHTV